MRLLTFDSKDKVGQFVAEHVVRRIAAFAPTADRPFVLGAHRRFLPWEPLAPT
jgi:glucosamine-6-phosphate deaminase